MGSKKWLQCALLVYCVPCHESFKVVCFPTYSSPSSSGAFMSCSNWDGFKNDISPSDTISFPSCSLHCYLIAMHSDIGWSWHSSSSSYLHLKSIHNNRFNQVKSLVSPVQGFFSKRSTLTHLKNSLQKASQAINYIKQLDVVYIDFSKAFDKFDHGYFPKN